MLVLLHPEDRDFETCVLSLKTPSSYVASEKDVYSKLTPDGEANDKRRFKSKRRISCYPPAASVTPKNERMNLSSGPANISRKADCWMTYEEYCNLTR